MSDRELTITRIFDAPRELVFRAWIDPDQFARWLGPKGFTARSVTTDPRAGGGWRSCIREGDAGADLWSSGVYREVVPPERLVFTFRWEEPASVETVVTITFADHGGKTEMTFHQAEFSTVDERDSHRGGWSQTFDRLVEFLTGQGE